MTKARWVFALVEVFLPKVIHIPQVDKMNAFPELFDHLHQWVVRVCAL